MSILVVEDNQVSSKIIEFNLRKNGYETIVVRSGREALERLASTLEVQLVITDIMMPEMDGLELLERIKNRPEWRGIPVIMCTSMTDLETVKKAAQAGCKHYLVKPIKPPQLLQKVRQVLAQERPVLEEKRRIMSDLGLDSEAYGKVLEAFGAVIDDTIAHLEKENNDGSVSGSSINLLHLFEGASLIGAQRLKDALDRLIIREQDEESKGEVSACGLLLRELKVLRGAMPPAKQSPSPSSGKEETGNGDTAKHRNRETRDGPPDKGQAEGPEKNKGGAGSVRCE